MNIVRTIFRIFFSKDSGNLNSVGQFIELYRQINSAIKKQGADPDNTAKELIKGNILGIAVESYLTAQREELAKKLPLKTTHLEQIFFEKKIFVGGGKVKSAKEVLTGYLNSDFEKGLEGQQEIPKREMISFKQVKDGDFEDSFLSINRNKEKVVMTKREIIDYCDKHKDKLRKDVYSTFFVYEEDGKFFVARVRFDDSGHLRLHVYAFDDSYVWGAEYALHLVVPATALKS